MDDKKKKLDELAKKMEETRKSWKKNKTLDLKERPKEVVKESIYKKKDISEKEIKQSTITKKGNSYYDNDGKLVVKNNEGIYVPYKSAVKQVELTQDNRSEQTKKTVKKYDDVIRNPGTLDKIAFLGEQPLNYLEDPAKIIGDLGFNGFPTSKENFDSFVKEINNPYKKESSIERALDRTIPKIPAAAFNYALANIGARTSAQALAEAYNPIPGFDIKSTFGKTRNAITSPSIARISGNDFDIDMPLNGKNINGIDDASEIYEFSNNSKSNTKKGKDFAYGGNLQQQNNNNNMLTEFNEGGSHEQNPLGGIPQGQSSNGQMNTVEQGETKAGQFVYSDRLYINEDLAKAMNLPGYIKGKSFASASKAINDKFKDRNDIHTKATQKELLDRLAQSQEQLKAEQEAINQSMQINQSEPEYPEQQQFGGGGPLFRNFSTQEDNPSNYTGNNNDGGGLASGNMSETNGFSVGNLGNQLGTMLNPNGYNGEDITKASNAGFENKHLQNADKYTQGLDQVQGVVAKSFGPVGEAVFGAKKLGENIGGAIGGDVGAGVKSLFSPEKSAITNWTDPDMKFGDKVLGSLPVIGGIKAKQSADKKLQTFKDTKNRVDNFYKYQFNENNDDTQVFALGGEIDPPTKTNFITTKQDSLNVLNRSIENEKAYLDKGYKLTNSYPLKSDVYSGMNKNYNTFVDKSKRNQPSNIIQNGKVISNVLNPSEYKRDLGNGLFEGRDLNNNYLNLDVKPSLYHQNIKPITQKVYTSADGNDIVNIPSYNSPIFTESLNKPVENKIQPINTQPITPSTTPIVKQPATILPVKKQTVNKIVNPVTDTLQKQNYGLSDIQKFKTIKHAQSNMLPAKKGNPEFQSFMKEKTNQKRRGGPLDEVTPPDTFPNGIYSYNNANDNLLFKKPSIPMADFNRPDNPTLYGNYNQFNEPINAKEYLLKNKGNYDKSVIKNIQSQIGASVDGIPGKETYVKSGLRHDGSEYPINLNADKALESALATPDSEVKPEYTLDDIKNMESSYNSNTPVSRDDKEKDYSKEKEYSKYKDYATNALRYAPVLGNILQKNKIGPAEVDSAIRNPYQYKKQYIDEAQYRNAADQQAALSMEALNKSGLSGNQLMAASLGSQLARTKGVAEGAMAAKMHNLNENKIAEQVKQQNEGDYIADVRRINDINAQNRANRDTQMSKFDAEIANSLGAIGKEETFKKMAEKMTGYDWMGKYLKANPNATPSEAKAAHDKEQEDKGKESKKYFENLPEFSDKIDYKTPGIVQNKKGGMMNLKFNKY